MAVDQRALARLSAQFHGVVTHRQLRNIGATDHEIAGLVRSGRYRRAARGVLVSAEHHRTPLQVVLVACRVSGGIASHATAGRLLGLRGVHFPEVPHVTVPHVRRVAPGPFVVHRSTLIPPEHIINRKDGIPTTNAARTAADLTAIVGLHGAESLIEQLLDERRCDLGELTRMARQLRTRGRSGLGVFDELLASRETWRRPVGSDLELRLARALDQGGFPVAERQSPVRLVDGKVVHPDLAWPMIRFAIEVNHVTWHGRTQQSRYDAWRYRQLRLVGWHVEAVSDADIEHRLESTVCDLRTLVERRSRELQVNLGAA